MAELTPNQKYARAKAAAIRAAIDTGQVVVGTWDEGLQDFVLRTSEDAAVGEERPAAAGDQVERRGGRLGSWVRKHILRRSE
jgi:hypothetical protein